MKYIHIVISLIISILGTIALMVLIFSPILHKVMSEKVITPLWADITTGIMSIALGILLFNVFYNFPPMERSNKDEINEK